MFFAGGRRTGIVPALQRILLAAVRQEFFLDSPGENVAMGEVAGQPAVPAATLTEPPRPGPHDKRQDAIVLPLHTVRLRALLLDRRRPEPPPLWRMLTQGKGHLNSKAGTAGRGAPARMATICTAESEMVGAIGFEPMTSTV